MAVSSYKNCLHFDLVIHSLSVIHYRCQHPLRRCVSAGPAGSLHQKRVNIHLHICTYLVAEAGASATLHLPLTVHLLT